MGQELFYLAYHVVDGQLVYPEGLDADGILAARQWVNACDLARLEPSSLRVLSFPPALSYLGGHPVDPALSFRDAFRVGLVGTYLDDRFACLAFSSFQGADQAGLAGTYQGDPERSLLDALLDHQVRRSVVVQSCCE